MIGSCGQSSDGEEEVEERLIAEPAPGARHSGQEAAGAREPDEIILREVILSRSMIDDDSSSDDRKEEEKALECGAPRRRGNHGFDGSSQPRGDERARRRLWGWDRPRPASTA